MRYYIVDINGSIYAESENRGKLVLRLSDIIQDMYDNGISPDEVAELELEII